MTGLSCELVPESVDTAYDVTVHQEKGMLLLRPFCSFLSFFYPFLDFESCKRQSKSWQHPPFMSLLLLLTPFER